MVWSCNDENFTLISEQIHELLNSKTVVEDEEIENKHFIENSFDWENIKKYLIKRNVNLNPENFSYDYCLKCCRILHPIFKNCNQFQNYVLIEDLNKSSMWKSHSSELLSFLQYSELQTFKIEAILLLTSIIEHVLGSIYFTLTQQQPPHLLRDLLKTNELNEYFGSFVIYFIRLIIGTPNSLNLRNIVWHGFPNPGEIPAHFVGVILITMTSLSKIYEKKPIAIHFREKIDNIDKYFDFMEDQILNLNIQIRNEDETSKLFENSKYCPKSHKIFWQTAYKYYLDNQYKQFIILILPQIELTYRLIYSELNDYDVSAKIDEYYITMDTIFEYEIPKNGANNRLYGVKFNEKLLKLSYDLFVSPQGPRIRDKISHGEVNLNFINQKVCLTLFTLGLALLGSSNDSINNFFENYESHFHVNAIFQKNFKISLKYYTKLEEIFNSKYFVEINQNKIIFDIKMEDIDNLICNLNLRIFGRHNEEKTIVGFLNRIVINIKGICENLQESYEMKLKLLADKQLRSRERKTLLCMIEMYPDVYKTLTEMLKTTCFIFLEMQNDEQSIWIVKFSNQILRFLKFYLKVVENFKESSCISKNKIDKFKIICKNFNEKLIIFKEECKLNY